MLRPGDRLIRNESRLGLNQNPNICIELARGTCIQFVHGDDWLLPGALQKLGRRSVAPVQRAVAARVRLHRFYELAQNWDLERAAAAGPVTAGHHHRDGAGRAAHRRGPAASGKATSGRASAAQIKRAIGTACACRAAPS